MDHSTFCTGTETEITLKLKVRLVSPYLGIQIKCQSLKEKGSPQYLMLLKTGLLLGSHFRNLEQQVKALAYPFTQWEQWIKQPTRARELQRPELKTICKAHRPLSLLPEHFLTLDIDIAPQKLMGSWRSLKTSGSDQQNLSGSLQRTQQNEEARWPFILGDARCRLCSNKTNENINSTALVSISSVLWPNKEAFSEAKDQKTEKAPVKHTGTDH